MNDMIQVLGTVAMDPKGEYNEETYYEKLNVVTYNDFSYMAKEGVYGENPSTSSKWQLIGGGIQNTVEYIFPKFWAGSLYGDCTIIKYKDKVIVIDCYNTQWWSEIDTMLSDNGVSHIDYLIITHYHGDHFGNFYNLANNNYIDENTQLYMPAETTTMGWSSTIATVKQFCTEHNLNYYVPKENEVLEIGYDLKLTFTNCDADILDSTYTSANIGRNQNNSSTVVLLEHNKIKVSFLADCEKEAYDRLEQLDFFTGNVALHKMGHHAIEATGNFNVLSTLSPKFAVATGNIGDFQKCAYINSYEGSVLESLGTTIYPVYMNQDYIKFKSDGINLYCENGTPYKVGDNTTSSGFTYYVDNSVTNDDFQDGSSTHPFKELMQAISSIPNYINTIITIRLADGTYGVPNDIETPTELFSNGIKIINNQKREIAIYGNSNDRTAVKINAVRIEESNVKFHDLTIMADNYIGLRGNYSQINLDNCLITSTAQSTYNGINLTNSSLFLKNCKIEKVKDGIYPQNSNVISYRTSFDSISGKPIVEYNVDNNNIIDFETSFSNNEILNNLYHFSKHINPVVLYSNPTPDNTKTRIDFNTNFNKFKMLIISVNYDNNAARKESFVVYNPVGNHVQIKDFRGGTNSCAFRSVDLYIGNNYVEMTGFTNFQLVYSNSSITNNYGTKVISINSIIGIQFEEITDISSINENTQI